MGGEIDSLNYTDSNKNNINQFVDIKYNFVEEGIGQTDFEYLTENDRIILMPKMKDRAAFLKGLKQYLKLNYEFSPNNTNLPNNINDENEFDLVNQDNAILC